ncbi:MAG: hypothetical protein HYZ39_02720 [Mycolicibacterium cosmeticum]|nr:hypothetical protein [Mycolicibacterium cosmeticum]
MDPGEAERAKAALRQVMINDGVPPDQIEARVNDLMAKANQPLPPSYRPPEVNGPEPGFGDGFADTWFGTEQQIRNLVGQGGPGEPGIGEAWGDLLKGTAEQFSGPFGPLNPAVNEVKAALNSPNAAYYLGQKSAEGAMTAPTLMFGGEGALARAGLDLPDGLPNDLVHPPQVSDSVVPQGHTLSAEGLDQVPPLADPINSMGAQIGREISMIPDGGPSHTQTLAARVTELQLSQTDAAQATNLAARVAFGETAGVATLPDGTKMVLPASLPQRIAMQVHPDGSVSVFRGDLMQFLPYLGQ